MSEQEPNSAPSEAGVSGRRVTVWGLGSFGGGAAAARFLARAGARVTVTDLKDAEALAASLDSLSDLELRLVLGEHRAEDLLGADLVVKSPAVPVHAEWLRKLEEAGVPLTTELALGVGRLRGPSALVTGSKGKSTTSGLLGAMLGCPVAGNNERPLLDAVDGLTPGQPLVLEVSSFMAHDLARVRAAGRLRWGAADAGPEEGLGAGPDLVVLTSLEPEHLNWHGTYEAYVAAKLSLLELGPRAVVLPDPALCPELERLARPRAEELGLTILRPQAADEAATTGLALLGPHNRSNALLAARAARFLGADAAAIARGAAAFQPLPHRLETVAVSSAGTRFVDDSTATTPRAAAAAVAGVPQPVVVLAGGSDKGASFAELGRAAARLAHTVVCLGQVGERVAEAVEAGLREEGGEARVVRHAGGFDEAFARALAACPPGGTLLLAPGTASYDMFPNFKARGERFRALAQAACRAAEA